MDEGLLKDCPHPYLEMLFVSNSHNYSFIHVNVKKLMWYLTIYARSQFLVPSKIVWIGSG